MPVACRLLVMDGGLMHKCSGQLLKCACSIVRLYVTLMVVRLAPTGLGSYALEVCPLWVFSMTGSNHLQTVYLFACRPWSDTVELGTALHCQASIPP